MSKVLADLKKDHENVAYMLDLLERELDAVHAAERTVDFEMMHDVMVYMTHYPDRVHHPKEDLMFARMRARTDEGVEEMDALEREHVSLVDKGTSFRDTLRLVVDGSLVERDELERAGRDYVEFLRFHMEREDRTVFVQAERVLEEEDWRAIAERFESQQDPVFGPIVQREFKALLAHIRGEGS